MTSKMESTYEGNFLEGLDLPEGKILSVTIESIAEPGTEKDAAKKLIKRAILSFAGKSKRLILNKTGYRIIKMLHGRDIAGWVGKEIMIQRRYLRENKGLELPHNTVCIRVVPPVGSPIPSKAVRFMGSEKPYSANDS